MRCLQKEGLFLGRQLTHSARIYGGSGLCNMETDKQGYTVRNHQGVTEMTMGHSKEESWFKVREKFLNLLQDDI